MNNLRLKAVSRLFVALFALFALSPAYAQTIPNLPTASNVNSTDLFAVSQSAVTKKATLNQTRPATRATWDFYDCGMMPNTSAVDNTPLLTACLQTINANAYNQGLVLKAPAGNWWFKSTVVVDYPIVIVGDSQSATVLDFYPATGGNYFFQFTGLHGTGGGIQNVTLWNATAADQVAALAPIANAGGWSPDFFRISNVNVTGGTGGTWSYPILWDGSARTEAPYASGAISGVSGATYTIPSLPVFTGNTSNGSNTVSAVSSTTGLAVGYYLQNGNFPGGVTQITSIGSGTITVFPAANANSTGTGFTLQLKPNAYQAHILLNITSGAANGKSGAILSNTSNTVTLSSAISPAPSPGDTFTIANDLQGLRDQFADNITVFNSSSDVEARQIRGFFAHDIFLTSNTNNDIIFKGNDNTYPNSGIAVSGLIANNVTFNYSTAVKLFGEIYGNLTVDANSAGMAVGQVGDTVSNASASFSVVSSAVPTLANKGITFGNASGILTQDASNLVWDNTNKRLGVGTASPSYKLDVRSSTGNVDGFISTTNAGSSADFFFQNTSRSWLIGVGPTTGLGDFTIYDNTGSASRFTALASGNVGISKSSPGYPLEIGVNTVIDGSVGFYGNAPVAQYSTTGITTGFSAGSGTTVASGSTFTGGTGSTAYTIGDIVKALKALGLIAN